MDPLRIIFIWLLAVVGVVAQGVNIPSLPTKSTNLATNDFFLVRETASGIDKKISVALMQTSGFGNTNASGGSTITNLNDILDVAVPSPSAGQVLSWNGTVWTNASAGAAAATNILAANTLFVDASNGNDSTGTRGRQDLPWQTIQAASSNMTSGDLMLIRPGSYSVAPDPSARTSFPNLGARIRFQNLTNIAIVADGARLTASLDGNIILFQNVTNAYITGLHIEGAGANRGTNNFGAILLDGTNKNVTITRNTIRNVGAHGVVTLHNQHASDFVSVTDNFFETGGSSGIPTLSYDGTAIATGGRYWDISGNYIRDWFRGVEFYTAGTNDVAHNKVVGNTIDQCWEAGIIVIPTTNAGEKHHNNLFQGNNITGPLAPLKSGMPGIPSGIVMQGGAYNVIQGNSISNIASVYIFVTNSGTGAFDTNAYVAAAGYGIRLGSEAGVSRYNLVADNQVNAIRYRGIEVVGTTYENVGNAVIDNYVFYSSDTSAIWLYGTSNAVVSGNIAYANVTGSQLEYSTNASIVGNTFFNNGSFGIQLYTNVISPLVYGNSLFGNNGGSGNVQLWNRNSTNPQLYNGNVRDKRAVFDGANSDASTPTFGWTNAQQNAFVQLHNGLTTNQTGNVNQKGSDWRIYSTVYGPGGLMFYNASSNVSAGFFDGIWGRFLVGGLNPGNFGPAGQFNVYVNTNAGLARDRHIVLSGRDWFSGTNTYSINAAANSGLSMLLFTQGYTNKSLMISDSDWDSTTNDNTAINLLMRPYWGEIGAMYANSNYATLSLKGSTVKFPHISTGSSLLMLDSNSNLTNVTLGSNLSLVGTTLSASGGGSNTSEIFLNGSSVSAPNFQDSSTALIRVASAVTNIAVYPTNLANAQIASGAAIAVSKLEQIDLGTDTAGNYAAGDAEGGAALTGDSATAFFSAGQIERARGGTGADTSAYGAGLLGSDGSNNTIDVDTAAELETALGGINVILSTEIDTSSEVAGIVGDETGTGAMVFSSAPNLTNTVAYTLLNVTNGVLAMSGPLQYTSETISASDIDWSSGNSFYKQLTANTTFTFSNQQNDYHIRAFLEQDGTGGRTVTWPSGIVWLSTTNQSTTAPNVDTNASRITIVDLFRRNGTNYGTAFGANARPLEDIAGVVSAAAGDILYYTGTVWTNLARGSTGQVLTTTNSTIQWLNAAAGTGSGDVLYTAFATTQFGTNSGTVYIKDGAVVTNLNVRGNLAVSNSITAYSLTITNDFGVLGSLTANSLVVSNSMTASNLSVTNLFTAYKGLFTNELAIPYDPAPTTDANGELAIDSTITDHRPLAQFRANSTNYYLVSIPTADLVATDGYVIKYDAANDKFTMAADATGAGGGDPVLVNGTAVGDGSGVAFTNTSTAVWEIDETTTPDLAKVYPTNIANAQIASGAAIAVSKLEAIDLGADTVGNYVIDVAGTAPDITSTHTPAEGSTATLSFTRPSTADVALSSSHATLSSTGIVFEGATADTLEGRLVSADITGADVTWTLPNSTGTIALLGGITLGTDTSGNYAAGDAEGGAALTGDSATAFFSAGQIERARGGTGADTSAYGNGLLGSDGSNNTLDVDTISEFSTALGITGTPSGSTFLRGDGVWGTPAGSGDVSRTDFNTNQFVTNATTWAIAIKDGATTTNLAVSSGTLTANAATVTNALRLSARSASTILATDSNKDVADVTVSAPITFSGGTLDLDETAAIGNNARVAVNKNSGATVGTRRRINFIEGSNVTLTVADDAGSEEVDVTIAASGTGSGDDAFVNGTDVTGAFSLTNTVASSTVASTTWSVTGNTTPTPDLVTVAIGAASQTDAGIVTAGTQTIGGAKTFAGDVTMTNLTVASTFSVTGDLSVGSLVVTNPVNNLYVTNLYLTNATASRAVFADSNRKLVTTGASADLSGALSDETGTGVSVFNTDPSILGLRLWGDSNQTNLFRFNANGSIHSNAVGTIQFKSGGGQFGGGTTDLAPGSGGVIATNFVRSNTGTFTNSLTLNGAAVMTNRVGVYRTFFVPAAAMEITTTNGATPSTFTPTGADNYTVDTYQFLNNVTNRVNFITTMPDEWDTTTTLKVKFHYVTKTATASNPVYWQIAAGAIADAGTPGATLGSYANAQDTTQSQNVLAISPASTALTIGNTPALGKQVLFQVMRDANNASDTYADTVELLGIQIQYKELSTEPTVW